MNKLAVVITYFGKLKPSFALWYESARRNADVDFFIFTDDIEPQNPAKNIKWFDFTLQNFNDLAIDKLGVNFKITKPYKLCDFKPMYGTIYSDYLKDYDYWAYGDLDVIYGTISDYLQKINYTRFDKINFAGHLCFIKNNKETNDIFKAHIEGSNDFTDILESRNVAFDERDMNTKFRALNKPMYDGIFAADLVNEKGMQITDKKNITRIFHITSKISSPKNYHYQLFMSENGKTVRYYRQFFKVKKDEFCYMHYRLELPIFFDDKTVDTYLLSFSPKGFFEIDASKLKNLKYFMKTVKQYNNRKPLIVEKFNAAIGIIKRFFKKQEK